MARIKEGGREADKGFSPCLLSCLRDGSTKRSLFLLMSFFAPTRSRQTLFCVITRPSHRPQLHSQKLRLLVFPTFLPVTFLITALLFILPFPCNAPLLFFLDFISRKLLLSSTTDTHHGRQQKRQRKAPVSDSQPDRALEHRELQCNHFSNV